MAAKLEKTRTPGVYRRGSRFVVPYRVGGKQRWETFAREAEAKRAKAARQTDIARGEFQERSRVTLYAYAKEWVERYQGRGKRGFREETRDEYRRLLEQRILPAFPERRRLTEITPLEVARFVAQLAEEIESDRTIRNIVSPLKSCLATAVREGLIRSNPASEIDLPSRPTIDDEDEGPVKAMSTEELQTLLAIIPARSRLPFEVLASTGLRISELAGLDWRHMKLDGSQACVQVRQRLVRGKLGPPKSRYGRRDMPIPHSLVLALRQHRSQSEWPRDSDPVFAARGGGRLDASNLAKRVLTPAAEEASVPWVGFHAFRHTCASMLFAQGRNAVQVQRLLGHHSAAFTLATYVHLLDGDIGEPLEILPHAQEREAAARSDSGEGQRPCARPG
jgi:integrase